MRIVIAGAGIGGLTAALALGAHGHTVTVIEGARELRPLGVGVNLLPHAVRELTELGLGDALARLGVATRRIVHTDPTGATLLDEPRGLAGGYAHPQYSVHRGRLQMMLLDAVRDRLGPGAVRTGTRVLAVDQDDDGVHVRVPGGVVDAAVLVGADGLHSRVRAQLHPGEGPLCWSGVRMWRGTTDPTAFSDGTTMAVVADGTTGAVVYPIGSGRVNWVVQSTVARPGPLPGDASWNAPGRAADVLALVRGWDIGWLDVAALVAGAEEILEYPMVDRDPLPWWGTGRVTLLGDAAHPMYPVGANGASQAIVDARVLADALAGRDDPAAGLAAYERVRRPATADVVTANRVMHASDAAPADTARAYRRATRAAARGVG